MSASVDSMRESVLCVSRSALEEWGGLQDGFFEDKLGWYARIVSNHAFDTRLNLEEDPSRKQIIPYVVVSDGNAIFVTARKSTQNEARLHGKLSIGVGGHINEEDVRAENDAIRAGMMRELHEELRIVCDAEPRFCGFINDDSNPVGRVHLGAVFFVIARAGSVSVNETDKMDGFWMSLDGLQGERHRLETWSSLVLDEARRWMNEH